MPISLPLPRLLGALLLALTMSSSIVVRGNEVNVEKMVSGLNDPVAFAFAPDGRIFIAERTAGLVRIAIDGQLLGDPFAEFAVCSSGERGLLGLALDPNFAKHPRVYVFVTSAPDSQRIVRLTARGNVASDETTILDHIPAAVIHNGGGLAFGPDGKLYFSVGDNGESSNARDPNLLPGKIHRIDPDGTVPNDNPWEGSTAFCIGCRNVFRFTFLPRAVPVIIYASENGTTTDDEINRVGAGADCGWPLVTGESDTPGLTSPLHSWTPTTAPVGIVCYHGTLFPQDFVGDVLYAEYTTGRIVRLHLDRGGTHVAKTEVLLDGGYGAIYDLEEAPDGSIWFSTGSALYRMAPTGPAFIRGNVDGLDGIDVHDALQLLTYMLGGGPKPSCLAAGDVNADNVIDLTDVVALLGYIYGTVPEIAPPYPRCGRDWKNRLDCGSFPLCR